MASDQFVDDCEIPLPLSFLINDGGSGFGYFVGMGLLTNRWGGSLVWSAGWWWFDCVGHWWWDLGLILGLIVLV